MNRTRIAACLLTLPLVLPAHADQVINDDLIVTQNICVGDGCVDGETFGEEDLKIKDSEPLLYFDDTSGDAADWLFRFNLGSYNFFRIVDLKALSAPFQIDGGTPSSALVLSTGTGDVGFGTALPQKELHVVDGAGPTLRLEQDASKGNVAQIYDLFATTTGVGLADETQGTVPFLIRRLAPTFAIYVTADGDVGLGTGTPEGKLHTKGDDVQLAYFESGNGGPVQVRFRTDSENRRFLAVNNANQVKSQLIFLDNSIKFTGQTDNGPNLWMTVSAAGIVTQGPFCNTPCDAVFDPEAFTPLPIEDHAAAMWANKFLGAVGPTSPDQPVNLTEKLGGMLHELEVAHIYIEELHTDLRNEKARNDALAAQMTALMARMAALEAVLQAE